MLSGYEGSVHDARMLSEAITFHGFPLPPPGKFYLADSGYANSEGFLTPYRGETYHLPEYRKRRHGLRTPREVFNYTHSSLRNCIERTFGVWKARFAILNKTNYYPFRKQAMIPVACAVIHNFIRTVQLRDELLDNYSDDAVPVEENLDANADVVVNDNEDVGTSSEIHQTTSDRSQMRIKRDMLATQMWERFQQHPWYRS